jgi:hypothetical protein
LALLAFLKRIFQNEPSHSEHHNEGDCNHRSQSRIAETFVDKPMHLALVYKASRQRWLGSKLILRAAGKRTIVGAARSLPVWECLKFSS